MTRPKEGIPRQWCILRTGDLFMPQSINVLLLATAYPLCKHCVPLPPPTNKCWTTESCQTRFTLLFLLSTECCMYYNNIYRYRFNEHGGLISAVFVLLWSYNKNKLVKIKTVPLIINLHILKPLYKLLYLRLFIKNKRFKIKKE